MNALQQRFFRSVPWLKARDSDLRCRFQTRPSGKIPDWFTMYHEFRQKFPQSKWFELGRPNSQFAHREGKNREKQHLPAFLKRLCLAKRCFKKQGLRLVYFPPLKEHIDSEHLARPCSEIQSSRDCSERRQLRAPCASTFTKMENSYFVQRNLKTNITKAPEASIA